MTTGTSRRNIDELLEIEKNDGYSSMSDAEIKNIIDYKVSLAELKISTEFNDVYSSQLFDTLKEISENQMAHASSLYEAVLNAKPIFSTTDGTEVD